MYQLLDIVNLYFARVGVVDDCNEEVQQDHLDYQLVGEPQDPYEVDVKLLEKLNTITFKFHVPRRIQGRRVITNGIAPHLYEHPVRVAQPLIVLRIVVDAQDYLAEREEKHPPNQEAQERADVTHAAPQQVD